MEVASSDDVGPCRGLGQVLAVALTCSFISSCVARRCLHKALSHLAKRDLNVK